MLTWTGKQGKLAHAGFGTAGAFAGGQSIKHFESSQVAALLARLALYAHRTHAREELLELRGPK